MRKEYTLVRTNFIADFFDALDDFMSNFTTLYTLIDSQTDRRVYHNISEELDLIFYHVPLTSQTSQQKIILVVTTEYDATKDVFYQKDVVCSGYSYARSNFVQGHPDQYKKNSAYYFPAPTIKEGETLIANYNRENDTFMLTVKREFTYNYGFDSPTSYRTESLVFGMVKKYLDFVGGFFYGGDFMNTYERYYSEAGGAGIYCLYDSEFQNIGFHIQPPPINHTGFWAYPWISHPYQDFQCACLNQLNKPDPDHNNRLDIILRIDMDEAHNRYKNETVADGFDRIAKKQQRGDRFIPCAGIPIDVKRRQIWATTMKLDYYVAMVCSITNSEVKLPRYEPLIGHSSIDRGHTNNTLNNISIVMPLWFMVRRDPEEIETYSGVGRSDVINFVNMYNMVADRIKNSTFPTKEKYEYDCMHIGSRRSMAGMKGYSGLAFKLDDEKPLPVDDRFELLAVEAMEAHKSGGDPVLNVQIGSVWGYGGDTLFTDMPQGSFLMRHPYTSFSSLTFTFADRAGVVLETVTWTYADLDAALMGNTSFDLLPANTQIMDGANKGEWLIEPFNNGSASHRFACDTHNCVLVDITGNL